MKLPAIPSADIATSYGTLQFPDTYIIDPNGKVVEKIVNCARLDGPEVPG